MADHTPTPWKTDGVYIVAPLGPTIADCKKSPAIDIGTSRTNAAFIVKAVNNHDALKASLAEMVGIYWGDGDGHEPPPKCIQRAMAALKSTEVQP